MSNSNDVRVVQPDAAESGELLEIALRQLSPLSAIRMVSDVDQGCIRVWKEDFASGSPIYSNEQRFADSQLSEAQTYFDSLK